MKNSNKRERKRRPLRVFSRVTFTSDRTRSRRRRRRRGGSGSSSSSSCSNSNSSNTMTGHARQCHVIAGKLASNAPQRQLFVAQNHSGKKRRKQKNYLKKERLFKSLTEMWLTFIFVFCIIFVKFL